jgi:RNA polymerase sigma-70 factor (ECF subfamily)
VIEGIFERSYGACSRLARARAASIVARYRLPSESRRDLEQEALVELWRKAPAYDSCRGSWRTFAERVVANRLASLVRHMGSQTLDSLGQEHIGDHVSLVASSAYMELSVDVWRLVATLPRVDRSVAVCLMDRSAVETAQCLRMSRAAVYRSICRLRFAFKAAGITQAESRPGSEPRLEAGSPRARS